MSETLRSFNKGSDNMPEGYEKLDRIESSTRNLTGQKVCGESLN